MQRETVSLALNQYLAATVAERLLKGKLSDEFTQYLCGNLYSRLPQSVQLLLPEPVWEKPEQARWQFSQCEQIAGHPDPVLCLLYDGTPLLAQHHKEWNIFAQRLVCFMGVTNILMFDHLSVKQPNGCVYHCFFSLVEARWIMQIHKRGQQNAA